MKQIAKLVVVVLALAFSHGAHAEIQKTKQIFPGKLVIGFHPVGFQVGFVGGGPGQPSSGGFAYKLAADVAGLVKDWQAQGLGLYVGGGFNYATTIANCALNACGHLLEVWGFVRLHINKLNIPLVPWVQAGVAGEILIYGLGQGVGGGAGFRFGGGLHYWLIKNLGLGVETNFNFGGVGIGGASGFFGYWDILLGARAAF